MQTLDRLDKPDILPDIFNFKVTVLKCLNRIYVDLLV